MKNITVTVVDLIFVMTCDFEKALTERTKSTFNTFFFKKIDEKNIEKFFDIEKDNLFYNVITNNFVEAMFVKFVTANDK